MNKYNCIVCGRKFPEGQGIIMNISETILTFHSKRCAYKFLRSLVEEMDRECINSPLNKIKRKFDELIEIKMKKAEKRI
jgi:hypothetical protein